MNFSTEPLSEFCVYTFLNNCCKVQNKRNNSQQFISVCHKSYIKIFNFMFQGLRCSSHHWPCLENLIIMLYVLNDYITCLFCIARAFESDPDFLAGLAIRDKIISEQASIIGDFELYCKG